MKYFCLIICLLTSRSAFSQAGIDSFRMAGDVLVTIDKPAAWKTTGNSKTIVILYALPNGNTTAQTMGKKMEEGDDWHFDIQHIKAQTKFIRQQLRRHNIVVVYLENDFRSWPAWKARHPEYVLQVQHIVDTVLNLFSGHGKELYLNGHSGGGRFIFSYLDGVEQIPGYVKRISFLDSNYGYEPDYLAKLKNWLTGNKDAYLNVFAYNDSVALYNGKPVVSATGGTWYRSHKMLQDLQKDFSITQRRSDSILVYKSRGNRIQFFLKTNPERKIFHTQQVELNGFIHSVLCGTRFDSRGYRYYTARAYSNMIE